MELRKLSGSWELKEAPLSAGVAKYGTVMENGGWIKATVPGDVHVDLIEAGRISEPLLGLNSRDSEWIEDRSWWYKTSFATEAGWLEADVVEMVLGGLDSMADIFLNEVHLGRHINTFRPFVKDIKDLLRRDGDNLLVVRLTCGLEHFSDENISYLKPYVGIENFGRRGDRRRVFIRKPQYSFGWDWNPRVPTCGITGEAFIRPLKAFAIRDVKCTTRLDGRSEGTAALLDIDVSVDQLDWIGTEEASAAVMVSGPGGWEQTVTKEAFLRSGHNSLNFSLDIEDPMLWWPNGMGDQNMYEIKVSITGAGVKAVYPPFKIGLRTVELDQTKLSDDERLFAIKINGVRVYCKGADWIPADSVYARVSDDKYETLIKEAREANFNMLRIWGGGLYERDCFYEFCDREGILLWHDFMFACGAYPDDQEWFTDEVRKEVEYQVTRLRNHPSIALWCGNNENTWGFLDWWGKRVKGGAFIYNTLIPQVLEAKSPEIPYWNSSPYGGKSPNCAEYGDRHHWGDCMMNSDMIRRITPEEYDKVDPKFISEYGYVGPCGLETTKAYLDGRPLDKTSDVWQHHNNTFEKNTVVAGINKHYTDPGSLSVEDYLLYAGLCQGMMYEYSLDSFRSKPNCHGGLFWMYNDCWGEVGWTIVDYYCRRKIAYNFVRRANTHKRLILREAGGRVSVTLANDTPEPIKGVLEYGYMAFDGSETDLYTASFSVGPFSREAVLSFDKGNRDLTLGGIIARVVGSPDDTGILPARLRACDFRELRFPVSELFTTQVDSNTFIIGAKSFAHGVHFDLPDGVKVSDEYFDLLPGEVRTVRIDGTDGTKFEDIVPKSILSKA